MKYVAIVQVVAQGSLRYQAKGQAALLGTCNMAESLISADRKSTHPISWQAWKRLCRRCQYLVCSQVLAGEMERNRSGSFKMVYLPFSLKTDSSLRLPLHLMASQKHAPLDSGTAWSWPFHAERPNPIPPCGKNCWADRLRCETVLRCPTNPCRGRQAAHNEFLSLQFPIVHSV